MREDKYIILLDKLSEIKTDTEVSKTDLINLKDNLKNMKNDFGDFKEDLLNIKDDVLLNKNIVNSQLVEIEKISLKLGSFEKRIGDNEYYFKVLTTLTKVISFLSLLGGTVALYMKFFDK